MSSIKNAIVATLLISAALSAASTGLYIKYYFTLWEPDQKELSSKFLFQTDKNSGVVDGLSMIVNGLVALVFSGLALFIGMNYKVSKLLLLCVLLPLFVASMYDAVAIHKANSLVGFYYEFVTIFENNPSYASLVGPMRFAYNTYLMDMISSPLAAGVCLLNAFYVLKRK